MGIHWTEYVPDIRCSGPSEKPVTHNFTAYATSTGLTLNPITPRLIFPMNLK
jgi:hypothetical protein